MKAIIFALVASVVIGCQNKHVAADQKTSVAALDQIEMEQPKLEEPSQVKPSGQQHADWDKKIIKTANLTLKVDDFSKSSTVIRELARKHGGYIAQEKQEQDTYQVKNTIIMKVPVTQFELAMNDLSAIKASLEDRTVTSEDVTIEAVDTRARIETKKQIRQRYVDLLRQAKNMEEILNVQNEINQTQEEIEMASNRLDYLTHASAMSTIHLTYYQILDPSIKAPTDKQFNDHIFTAFLQGWQLIKGLLLVIVTIWPLLLAGVFLFFFYKKRIRKRTVTT